MITKFNCKTCGKVTEVIGTEDTGNAKYKKELFKCGHFRIIKQQEVTEVKIDENKALIQAMTGEETFKYQDIGIQFGEKANGSWLCADEMGLGKTIQALGYIKLHRKEALPCIIICKSIAKYNWFKETLRWINAGIIPQEIKASKDKWFATSQIHIVSYDIIRSFMTIEKNMRDEDSDLLPIEPIKKEIRFDVKEVFDRAQTIIIDECHYLKNDVSQRTVAIKKLCKGKKHIIALSGTPIKNNASEYFPILNILRPQIFSNRANFLKKYCSSFWNGYTYKTGGLKNPEYFKERTKDFIIRREMSEVLPDLPSVRRNNSFVELESATQNIYDKEWKEFTEYYEENEFGKKDFDFYNNVLARLSKLRHITGISKVGAAVEFVEDFITSTNRKIVLFIHHQKVGELLKQQLNERFDLLNKEMGMNLGPVIMLEAKDIGNVEKIVEDFKSDKGRVLVASTLSAGESINLQFCSDCLLVERQWNPSNEEQAAVGRFKRIGQVNSINLNYLLAAGTIDDYFTELIEQKRQVFEEVMTGKSSEVPWNEQSIVMELAATLTAKGKMKFRL